MRVLNVYAGNLFGGIETMLLALLRHGPLSPGLEFEFALCFEGRLASELRALGGTVHSLGEVRTRMPWTVVKARSRLRELLSRNTYDAVICHAAWSQAIFASVVRKHRRPQVFFAHDAVSGKHWIEKWARLTPADLVLANSAFTARETRALYPQTEQRVWHYPVSPQAENESREVVRAELNTPRDAVVIIQSSRMQDWKGHRLLLSALSQVRDLPGWECWIAGGPQRDEERAYALDLHRQAESAGIAQRVRFLGQRTDIPRLLASADIHCQPNLGPEPFGIAFIEALYAGLPVLTTRMGAAEEILDESCGRLVAPSTNALSKALRSLIRDEALRRHLAESGPSRAQALCDPATQLEKLTSHLVGLVRHRSL